jgi:hypothetical protein
MDPSNLKHQLSATVDPGGRAASGVVASCKHREGSLAAGRVREMMVAPFPGKLMVVQPEAHTRNSTAGLASQLTLIQWPLRRSGRPGREGSTGGWCWSGGAGRSGQQDCKPGRAECGAAEVETEWSGSRESQALTGMVSQYRAPRLVRYR